MKIWKYGISVNDGGCGPIFVWTKHIFYVCFWTKWIAPRFYIVLGKGHLEFNP